jgi:formylglycine-generating enzyme required for sulfatase activity
MNDDFLHRLRVEPPAQFLVDLKTKLDTQDLGLPSKYRYSFRISIIAMLMAGTGLVLALVIGGYLQHPTGRKSSTDDTGVPANTAYLAGKGANIGQSNPAGLPVPTVSEAVNDASEPNAVAPAGVKPLALEWVLIPSGTFTMGATGSQAAEFYAFPGPESWRSRTKPLVESSQPAHEVYLDDFFIMRTEVTNFQYVQVVGREADNSRFGGPNQPVVGVNWADAQVYCASIGARLPTEAEWEKAARGPQGFTYPWGNKWDPARLQSADGIAHRLLGSVQDWQTWRRTERSQQLKTADVGSFPDGASPYGVMDMAGNVWEWVADWFDPNYYLTSPQRNPRGPVAGEFKVLRGGAWDTPRPVNFSWYRETFIRPEDSRSVTGFRCAKDQS